MASKPKIAPPPPPVVDPPIDEIVHAGTPDDPYVYSDGTPIVYLDGEDQVAYTARVQAMVDAATAGTQVSETPASPSSVPVDPDASVPPADADGGVAAVPPVQPASTPDSGAAEVPPVAAMGQAPATAVSSAPPTIPGSDIPVAPPAPAAPVIPAPPVAPVPPTSVVAAGSQTSPVVPPVPAVPVATGQQPAPPPPVVTATTSPPIVKPPSPPAPLEAAISETDAGILPGHFQTMDDYMEAQRAGAAKVAAAYAEANANKTVAEMSADEIAALAEISAVEDMSVDDRLRRLEQHAGLRSPRAKA